MATTGGCQRGHRGDAGNGERPGAVTRVRHQAPDAEEHRSVVRWREVGAQRHDDPGAEPVADTEQHPDQGERDGAAGQRQDDVRDAENDHRRNGAPHPAVAVEHPTGRIEQQHVDGTGDPEDHRDRRGGQAEMDAPQRQHHLAGRPDGAHQEHGEPDGAKRRAFAAQHLGEAGSLRRPRRRGQGGFGRAFRQIADQEKDDAGRQRCHQMHAVGAGLAGQVDDRATQERSDEQADPVDPAERRHRPAAKVERDHGGDIGLPGELPHRGPGAGGEHGRSEHGQVRRPHAYGERRRRQDRGRHHGRPFAEPGREGTGRDVRDELPEPGDRHDEGGRRRGGPEFLGGDDDDRRDGALTQCEQRGRQERCGGDLAERDRRIRRTFVHHLRSPPGGTVPAATRRCRRV